MIALEEQRIVISRTDSIGDVILTLPLCAWIKANHPNVTILFLGRTYTQPIIEAFDAVDQFVDWTELEEMPKSLQIQKFRELNADIILHVFPRREIAQLAKTAKIPVRVGTSHRNFHLLTCNHRLNFTRKRSDFHEAQLNFHLLKPFGLKDPPDWNDLEKHSSLFHARVGDLPEDLMNLSKPVILHPRSQGSAVEWPMTKYVELAEKLINLGYTPVFTGTEKEGELFRADLQGRSGMVDASGKLRLDQLIAFIERSCGLVACSTGPLHIAGMLGVPTVGLFSPRKPIHPGRWRPIGKRAVAIVYDEDCPACKKGKSCDCITRIDPDRVLEVLTAL